jgi:hypothetical protein
MFTSSRADVHESFPIIYWNTVYYGKQPAEDVILTGLVLIFIMSVGPGFCTVPKIRFMYTQKLHGLVPNSYIHICERFIYSHEFGNWEIEHFISVLEITRPHSFISGNTLLWNQTFILASHRLFICSVRTCAVMWTCCVFGYVMSLLRLYTLHNPSPKARQYLCSPLKPPQPKGFLQQFPCMKTREEGRGVVPLPAR